MVALSSGYWVISRRTLAHRLEKSHRRRCNVRHVLRMIDTAHSCRAVLAHRVWIYLAPKSHDDGPMQPLRALVRRQWPVATMSAGELIVSRVRGRARSLPRSKLLGQHFVLDITPPALEEICPGNDARSMRHVHYTLCCVCSQGLWALSMSIRNAQVVARDDW